MSCCLSTGPTDFMELMTRHLLGDSKEDNRCDQTVADDDDGSGLTPHDIEEIKQLIEAKRARNRRGSVRSATDFVSATPLRTPFVSVEDSTEAAASNNDVIGELKDRAVHGDRPQAPVN